MDKTELRKHYKEVRRNVENRKQKERAICDKLLGIAKCVRSVFIYESLPGEVSTSRIIERLDKYAQVFVPEVVGNDMLIKRRGQDVYADKPCDLTVVPLIAFDRTLNRIGFGGGYYDRYLSSNQTLSVGIAFDEQECEEFEKLATDIPLDIIVTPTRIMKKN